MDLQISIYLIKVIMNHLKFIYELLKNNFIKKDDSDSMQLSSESKINSFKNSEFLLGNNYIPLNSMSELSKNIINLSLLSTKVDFYFQTLIVDLNFSQNIWNLIAQNGVEFKCKYLVCSSNLLLHKRSKQILNVKQVPLRNLFQKIRIKQLIRLIV